MVVRAKSWNCCKFEDVVLVSALHMLAKQEHQYNVYIRPQCTTDSLMVGISCQNMAPFQYPGNPSMCL